MGFLPSPYQSNIFNFVESGEGNALINAVAGSGKSTTLLEAIKRIPTSQTVLMLAFNKSIVEELKAKIGKTPNVQVMTLHSLGTRAIMAFEPAKIEADKYTAYINKGFNQNFFKPTRELDREDMAEYRSNIKKLVDLIRVSLIRSFDEALALADKHDIYLVDNEMQIVSHAIKWGRENKSTIDFTDMIYFPNVLDLAMPQFDWVLIDECQDLNAAQRGLFLKCLKPNGRFIAVGDPKQAIYGFAGADAHSFSLIGDLPNTKHFPLSVCYRCAKSIIQAAKHIVPQIEWQENAMAGDVNHEALLKEVMDGDAILCRNTAPLTKLCMTYIANGTKAYIKGRDIGANLINMVSKTNCVLIDEALVIFENELNKIIEKEMRAKACTFQEASQSKQALFFQDKVAAIEVLSEGLIYSQDLIGRINQIFSDDNKEGICLSTVHKAKGLEWKRVYIACENKFYHPKAMETPWMAEQERNLVYVAYTRAKEYLGFIIDFDF